MRCRCIAALGRLRAKGGNAPVHSWDAVSRRPAPVRGGAVIVQIFIDNRLRQWQWRVGSAYMNFLHDSADVACCRAQRKDVNAKKV